MTQRVHELFIPCELWSVNSDRTMHWARRQDKVNATRWAAKIAALDHKIPTLDRVTITAQPRQARGTLADPGNHMPPVKACIDGLRDARVLTDDTGVYVANIDMLAPVRVATKQVGIMLRLEVQA